jgi:hypothetical protein
MYYYRNTQYGLTMTKATKTHSVAHGTLRCRTLASAVSETAILPRRPLDPATIVTCVKRSVANLYRGCRIRSQRS